MTKLNFKSLLICCLCFAGISCSNNKLGDVKLIPVKTGEKWGYIGKKGEYVINPQFADADFFRDDLAKIVSFDGKVGFIDKEGKYVIVAKFKNATAFSDGLAFTVSDGGYPVCIDKRGETRFTLKQAKCACSFSEGLAAFVTADQKIGFVDKSGAIAINPQFDAAQPFSEGLAAVRQKDQWGFIDKTGKIVINPQFVNVGDFKNGIAVFSNGKSSGYIDTKGAYTINPQFDFADSFSEGMARVKSGREFGYINETGKVEINPQFDHADSFNSGLAAIEQGNRYGFINKKGKIEINPQFDSASQFYGDIAFVRSANKWGIIDKKGKYLVNPQFDAICTNPTQYSYVVSDYYDVTEFIGKFFERAKDNSFDGFNASSTLQTILDHPIYGNEANAEWSTLVKCRTSHQLTPDIYCGNVSFESSVETPFYINDFYNREYQLGTKIAKIRYYIILDCYSEADKHRQAIIEALKTEIENRYKVKVTEEDHTILFSLQGGDNLKFEIGVHSGCE